MAEGFEISFSFVELFGRYSKPEYLQVYIYLLGKFCKDGTLLTAEETAWALQMPKEVVDAAMDYWIACKQMVRLEDGRYGFTRQEPPVAETKKSKKKTAEAAVEKQNTKEDGKAETASPAARARFRPTYDMEEIDAAVAQNGKIDALFKQAEVILNKLLTRSDMEMLYSFYSWLGLPVEVIIMLLTYGARHEKTGRRYLETVAMDWADQGIDTYEKAEEYVSRLEEADAKEYKIRAVLGIYDRALTTREKKYLKQWTQEPNLTPEMISLAYDRTVERTGKLSWAYLNKILTSWTEEGLLTAEAVEASEAAFKKEHSFAVNVPQKAKSKFNNYTDPNRIDYDSIGKKLLEDMLDE